MVRFLNAPQTQIPTMEDPTWGALSRLAGKIGGRMVENQQLREKSSRENTEQIQKFMQTYIGAGFTPEESLTMAQQMTGKYKEPDTSRDPWTQLGGITVPNPINIGQNVWEQLATPKWQAPDYSQMKMPKLRKQMTYAELGEQSPYPNLTPEEAKDRAAIEKDIATAKYYTKRETPGSKEDKFASPIWKAAEKIIYGDDKTQTSGLLAEDPVYRQLQAENPEAAYIYALNKTEEQYQRLLQLGKGNVAAGSIPMPTNTQKPAEKVGIWQRLAGWLSGGQIPAAQTQKQITGTDPKSGKKVVLVNGKWQPIR